LKHFQELKDLKDQVIVVKKDYQNVTATKVIGIFNEKSDLVDELHAFKELARHYSQYLDIIFYLVSHTNHSTTKGYKLSCCRSSL
jgi:hypothetical protein